MPFADIHVFTVIEYLFVCLFVYSDNELDTIFIEMFHVLIPLSKLEISRIRYFGANKETGTKAVITFTST